MPQLERSSLDDGKDGSIKIATCMKPVETNANTLNVKWMILTLIKSIHLDE